MSELAVSDLPDNWVEGKVQDLITIRNGYAFKSKYFQDDEGTPVIRQTNLSTDVVNFKKPKYLPSEFIDEHPDFKVIKGDMLIGLSGSIGNLSRYMEDLPALQNQRTGLLVERIPGATKFVKYYLQLIKKDLLVAAKGVAVQNISSKTIENWPMPIAPLAQQKRIVCKIEELFSHIDAGIASLNKSKKLLEQYRQSVLKAAVTGELTKQWREKNINELEPANRLLERILSEHREKWEAQQLLQFEAKGKVPKDDKWKNKYKETAVHRNEGLFDVPNTWSWAYMGQLGDIVGGLTKNKKRETFELQLPYLRVANVYADELRLDEVKEIGVQESELDRVLLEYGDLLIVEGNGSPDQIGRLAIWDSSIEPCVHQNHIIKVRLAEKSSGSFIMRWLSSMGGRDAILDVASSTTGLYTLSISKIEGLSVPIPPLSEMVEIGARVEEKLLSIGRLLLDVNRQVVKAEKNKLSILTSAFSGQLVGMIDTDGNVEDLLQEIKKQNVLNEAKQKLTKKRPTVKKVKGMPKRKILDVLKEFSEPVVVDKIFEASGYSDDLSSENIERFYSELKTVVALNEVKVYQVSENETKQEDRILYKAL
jgi:type I restriction enzyme S subunit